MSSKRMLAWICSLSFIGGYVDVYGFITIAFPLTHFTGSVSKVAMDGLHIQFDKDFYQLLVCMSFFILGNILAGYFIGERQFSFKKRYGLIFIGIGVILTAVFFFTNENLTFIYLLSVAVGIQNGLFITYKGILVRTSHITGTISDLGVYIGYLLRGKVYDKWKLFYYFISLISFFVGGVISRFMYRMIGKESVYLISFGYIVVGLIYLSARKHIGEIFYILKRKFNL